MKVEVLIFLIIVIIFVSITLYNTYHDQKDCYNCGDDYIEGYQTSLADDYDDMDDMDYMDDIEYTDTQSDKLDFTFDPKGGNMNFVKDKGKQVPYEFNENCLHPDITSCLMSDCSEGICALGGKCYPATHTA